MKNKLPLFIILFLLSCLQSPAQKDQPLPQGNLFIIGGGDRSPQLIQRLIETAQLSSKDHIAILPMSGEEPDTSFYYIKIQLG